MQDYNLLRASDLISNSRATINNDLESLKSNFSGTYFPTQNLAEGMLCWRTDLKKMYQLQPDLTSWTLVFDMSQGQNRVQYANESVYAEKDGLGNNIADTYYRQDLIARLKDDMYPVGSVIITMTSDNPSTWLGGEWQQIAGGRTLIGASASYRAGNTGGSESQNITLTTSNLPAHKHNVSVSGSTASAGAHTHTRGTMEITGKFRGFTSEYGQSRGEGAFTNVTQYWGTACYGRDSTLAGMDFTASKTWEGETSSNGAHTHTLTTNVSEQNVGNGTAINVSHLQPYLVTYFWQKVRKAFN